MPGYGYGFGYGAVGAGGVPGGVSLPKLVVLVAWGQSNQEGVGPRDPALDVDHPTPSIYQWPSAGGYIGTPTIMADTTPLRHNDVALRDGGTGHSNPAGNVSWYSPAEATARELINSGYCSKVLIVPCARGSTPLVSTVTPSWNPSLSGDLTDIAIAQANAAIAAIASFPAFAGHSVEVILSWVQGERDADNGETRAAYETQFAALVGRFRSEITGATNAKLLIGSMLPNWWATGGGNFSTAYQAINHAHVLDSLSISNAYYWRGSAGFVAAPDGKHYAPVAVVREQGARIAYPITRPNEAVPTITSANAVGTVNGQPFSMALTHDAEHGTFHIVGGSHAGLFEISDPYLSPQLRWLGAGTGPTSDGAYQVQIAARNGAHVQGPIQTIAVTVATPAAPTDTSYTAAAGSPFLGDAPSGVRNYVQFASVPLKAGVNILAIVTDSKAINAIYANNTNGVSTQPGSVTATKVADPDAGTSFDVSLWQVVMGSDGSVPIWVQGSASGFNCGMAVGALVGAAAGVVDTALKVSGSVASPATTGADTLVVPNHGLGIALAKVGGATETAWLDGLTKIGSDLVVGTVRLSLATVPANFSGAIRVTSAASGQGIAAGAWALA